MGHRHIESTMVYVHLAQGLINTSDDYLCKIAKNINEAMQLVEQGFEYVTEMEGVKLFKKRK